jgi:plasmid stabilization system protein ParE
VRYHVVFTPRARADALEAVRWLAERSPGAAARWYAGLQRAVGKLAENPERHPVAEEESELLGLTIRQMLYGRRRGVYRILYSVEGQTITLHHVRHSAQGPLEP